MIPNPEMNEDIKFFTKSEIRIKILSELEKEPMTVKEIVNNTNMTYSSVSNNIGKLRQTNHVVKNNNLYSLNPISGIYFKTIMDFRSSAELIDSFKEFWYQHNINNLSMESIQNITDLKNSDLIETTPIDIYKTHNIIKQRILESENMKAIFPYLHPEYPELVEEILRNNGHVELILPKCIFKETVYNIDENTRRIAAREGRFKVFVAHNNLKLYLAVYDDGMGLGLFKNDGSFDQNRLLLSNDEKSKIWASKLFESVKNNM